MNCWVCALEDKEVNAVAVCEECGVALCAVHKLEGEAHRVGGMRYGCAHMDKTAEAPAAVGDPALARD